MKILELLEDDHYYFVICELMKGGELDDFRKKMGGKLSEATVIHIV